MVSISVEVGLNVGSRLIKELNGNHCWSPSEGGRENEETVYMCEIRLHGVVHFRNDMVKKSTHLCHGEDCSFYFGTACTAQVGNVPFKGISRVQKKKTKFSLLSEIVWRGVALYIPTALK